MLQIFEWRRDVNKYILGEGQKIESLMAEELGVKVFQVKTGRYNANFNFPIDKLLRAVRSWDAQPTDMSLVILEDA